MDDMLVMGGRWGMTGWGGVGGGVPGAAGFLTCTVGRGLSPLRLPPFTHVLGSLIYCSVVRCEQYKFACCVCARANTHVKEAIHERARWGVRQT